MSIEQRLVELTTAITDLTQKLTTTPANSSSKGAINSTPETQPTVDKTTKAESAGDEKPEGKASDGNVAGRKTLVWDKTAKEGTIIEKGEVVPTGDNLSNVAKAKWDQLCAKYNLDPATGKAAAAEEPEEEDLDDLDLPEDEGDDGLGLDDDEDAPEIDLKTVKTKLIELMRSHSREGVVKLLKKHGAKNADELAPGKYQAIHDEATALIKA